MGKITVLIKTKTKFLIRCQLIRPIFLLKVLVDFLWSFDKERNMISVNEIDNQVFLQASSETSVLICFNWVNCSFRTTLGKVNPAFSF